MIDTWISPTLLKVVRRSVGLGLASCVLALGLANCAPALIDPQGVAGRTVAQVAPPPEVPRLAPRAAPLPARDRVMPQPATPRPTIPPREPPRMVRSSASPSPPATPSTQPAPEFPAVTTHEPHLRLDDVDPSAGDPVGLALTVPGVAFAADLELGELVVAASDGAAVRIGVAAVDPSGFRMLSPQVTADVVGVWERLVDGDAVFEHDSAARLGVDLGELLAAGGAEGGLRVGAYAATSRPVVADALVSHETGRRLGIGGRRSLLVALDDPDDAETAGDALEDRFAGSRAVVLVPQEVAHPEVAALDPLAGDDRVWDLLAQCESGGNWHIDTGNGYYGGLQFLPSSWALVGGTGLPHEATREEQIARAKLLWAYQGWEAWPACSLRLGLR